MRFALWLLPLFLLVASPAKAITLGLVLTTPEIVGAEVSIWPTNGLTIDGRVTLASADVGVTGHIPFAGVINERHDFLISGMGGYIFDGVSYYGPHDSSFHWVAMAGYGFLYNSLDLRLQAGASGSRAGDGWATGFTAQAMLGKQF